MDFDVWIFGHDGWQETNMVVESSTTWQAKKEAEKLFDAGLVCVVRRPD